MVISSPPSNKEDTLQRSDIRTMKKDLARLREADSLKEREKIQNTKPLKSSVNSPALKDKVSMPISSKKEPLNPVGQPSILPPPTQQTTAQPLASTQEKKEGFKKPDAKPRNIEEFLEQNIEIEKDSLFNKTLEEKPEAPFAIKIESKPADQPKKTDIKPTVTPTQRPQENLNQQPIQKKEQDMGTILEAQKQKAFLLRKEKEALQNQASSFSQPNHNISDVQKNKLLHQEEDLKKKLNKIIDEENENEQAQQAIEAQEKSTSNIKERHRLEKEKWKLEDKRQQIEKKRWPIETSLEKLENKIHDIDQTNQETKHQTDHISSKIKGIEEELETIKTAELNSKKTSQTTPSDSQETPAKKPETLQEKPYLKEVPAAMKEKIAKAAQSESEQRKKFLEDVEKWATSSQDNEN